MTRRAPLPRARRVVGVVVAAVVTLALSGVARAAPSSPTASGASHRGVAHRPPLVQVNGGTATVALDTVPTTLNDHTLAGATDATRMVASAVWPQVFRVAPGTTPQLDTNVVDSAEVVSVNPQTVVYQIDPRATWSDGVPLSADDFVYAWQSQRGGATDVDGTPDSVASTLGYRDITSVTGSNDGRTVTVVFRLPFTDWASLFDDMVPAHVADTVGWNHGFDRFDAAVLVSAGPWLVQSWQHGVQIVLVRNPHWWASPARLDRVVMRAVPGSDALTSALGSGQVQVAYPASFDASFLAQVSSSASLQTQAQLGTRMLQLEFNVRHAPLDSVAVRQGVAHAVDRAAIATMAGQPEDHSVWEDNDHLFSNGQAWYADDAQGYQRLDLPAAARLLEQGGLVADARGTWTLRGSPVDLTVVWASDDPWSAASGPLIVGELVDAGFDVTAVPVPAADLVGAVLPAGAFDLALVAVHAGAYPTAVARAFSSAPAVTGVGTVSDWSGFDDPHIDALFTQAAQELAAAHDQSLYQQIDQALWTAMPTLPLFAEPTVLVWSASLSAVSDDPGGLGPMWSMRVWARLAAAPRSAVTGTTQAIRSDGRRR